MLLVLGHRLLWPMWSGPIYAARRLGSLKEKKLLWGIMLVFVFGPRNIIELIKTFG